MSAWDTSIEATVERLRRVYASKSNDEVCAVYGVKKWDAGAWHREQDERALARQFIADFGSAANRERLTGEVAVLRGACQRALAAVPPESEIADDLRGVLLITEGRS